MRRFTVNQLSNYRGRFNWGDVCACIYCGEDVEPTDWADGDRPQENLGLSDHHFGCWHSGKFEGDGRYMVISNVRDRDVNGQVRDPLDDNHIRFPWLNRAIDCAQQYAGWNNDTSVYLVVDRETGEQMFAAQGAYRTKVAA